MKHDFKRSRLVADRMIKKWGFTAALRRASGDRPCSVVIQDFTPMERMGKMIDPVDRLAMVSALAPDGTVLDPPPDRDQDMLVTYVPETDPPVEHETLKMSKPTGELAPGGVVVYWEMNVRR